MKFLKLTLIILVVLTILIFVGLLVFLQFFKIDQYLPQITQKISHSIGRKVTVNHADLGFDLVHGLALDLKIVAISDHLDPDAHDFIVIDKAHIALDLTALIFKQKVRATDIKLNSIHLYINPYHFIIQDIHMRVDNFLLNEPFDFKIDVSAYSKSNDNVEMSGQAILDLNKASLQIKDLKIKTDLNQWNWAKLRAVTPTFKDLLLWPLQDLKGNVLIVVPELFVSSKGVGDFSIELKSQLGGGDIDAKVAFKEISTQPQYQFEIYSRSLRVEDILDQKSWPVGLKGVITGQLVGSSKSFEAPVMLENLEARGNVQLDDAKIERLNVLKIVVDKLNFIPGLGSIFQGALPVEIKDKFNADATILEKAEIKMTVLNKLITINQAEIKSRFISILAQGTVAFDLKTDIDVNTYLDSDISSFLIRSISPLKGLLNEQKQIYIPGQLIGRPPSIAYSPAIDYITKKMIISEGSQQISGQLDKVLNKNPQVKDILNAVLGDGASQNGSLEDQSSVDSSANQESSKKIINNILKDILN